MTWPVGHTVYSTGSYLIYYRLGNHSITCRESEPCACRQTWIHLDRPSFRFPFPLKYAYTSAKRPGVKKRATGIRSDKAARHTVVVVRLVILVLVNWTPKYPIRGIIGVDALFATIDFLVSAQRLLLITSTGRRPVEGMHRNIIAMRSPQSDKAKHF